jgi:hypothetical protein
MRTELPDTATISLWPINRQNPLSLQRTKMSRRRAHASRRKAQAFRRRVRARRRLPRLAQRHNHALVGRRTSPLWSS